MAIPTPSPRESSPVSLSSVSAASSSDAEFETRPVTDLLRTKIGAFKATIVALRQELSAKEAKLDAYAQLGLDSFPENDLKSQLPPSPPSTDGWSPATQTLCGVLQRFAAQIYDLKNQLNRVDAEIAHYEASMARSHLRDIEEGRPLAFLKELDPSLVGKVVTCLNQALQHPSDPLLVYRYALFIANFDRSRLDYESLRTWLITRACTAQEFLPSELTLRATLLLALSKEENAIPEDLSEPLEQIAALRDVAAQACRSDDPLAWVRAHLTNEDAATQKFLEILYAKLSLQQVPPLTRPGGKQALKECMTLEQQLEESPQFNLSVTSSKYYDNNGQPQQLTGEEWKRNHKTREDRIRTTIQECANVGNLLEQMLALRSDATKQPISKPAAAPLLQELEKKFQTGFNLSEKDGLLTQIENEFAERIEQLTGLATLPKQRPSLAEALFNAFVAGNLCSVLERAFKQGDGSQMYALAQLLYYYAAIKGYQNPKFPPAGMNIWAWMIPASLPTKEKVRRLQILIQHIQRDPYLRGSSLTQAQVLWAESLYYNLTKGTNLQINEEPGSGKTVSVAFSLRLLQAIFPECQKEVHWISPFVNAIDGLTPYLLQPDDDLKSLESPTFAGAADEAHKLKPGLSIAPVHITATPVIPDLGEEAQRKKELSRLQGLEKEVTALLQQKKDALAKAEASCEKERKDLESFICAHAPLFNTTEYKNKLPKPRQGKTDRYFKGLNRQSIHEILLCVNAGTDWTKLNSGLATARTNKTETSYWIGLSKSKKSPELKELEKSCIQWLLLQEGRLQEPGFEINRDSSAAANIGQLRDQVTILDLYALEIQEKIVTMGGKIERQKKPAYLADLPDRKAKAFETMAYFSAAQAEFTPENTAQMVAEGFQKQTPGKLIQLVFPNARFSTESLQATLTALEHVIPQKPVHFVFRDSYSEGPDRGKNWVMTANGEKEALETFVPKEGTVVMLYDWTNQQGGDFGAISRAYHADHNLPINIYLFHNLGSGNITPSADDVFQGISRRRKPPLDQQLLSPVVFAPAVTKETFIKTAVQRQKQLEKLWAADQVAKRAAKKIFKAYQMRQGKVMRGRRMEEVVGENHADVISQLRTAILQMTPDDVKNQNALYNALRAKGVSFKEIEIFQSPSAEDDFKENDFKNAPFASDNWRQRKTTEGAFYLIQQAVGITQ